MTMISILGVLFSNIDILSRDMGRNLWVSSLALLYGIKKRLFLPNFTVLGYI